MKFMTLVIAFAMTIASIAGFTIKIPHPQKVEIKVQKNSTPIKSFPIDTPLISYNLAPKSASEIKEANCKAYIEKYASLAKNEAKRSGIPYSIIMAQALIESNAGISILARDNNNHFGQKCLEKNCKTGHCNNHTDDSHKDFFRIFKSVEESYVSHSKLLKKDRYKRLFDYPTSDYKTWATGLQLCGYATDKAYAKKLIEIIEKYKLNE